MKKYPLAGELQRKTMFRLTGNPDSEDGKVARAKACTLAYHAEIKRDRFDDLKLLGVQKLASEEGEPDEWMIVRQCDRCPSSVSKIVDYDPSNLKPNPRGRRKNASDRDDVLREARANFWDLLHDPNPSSMEVAQDIVLQYGLSLITLSQLPILDEEEAAGVVANGTFALEPNPYDVFSTSVQWSVAYQGSSSSFNVTIRWRYLWAYGKPGGVEEELFPGKGFRSLDDARKAVVADAWAIACALKEMASYGKPTKNELVDRISTVYADAGDGGWIGILPAELFESPPPQPARKPRAKGRTR